MTVAPKRGSLKFENFISLVLQRNYEAIKTVISADDFDINKEDFRGVTVLHYAAELGDVELIEMILKQHPKVKINAKTLEIMSTPLMIAAGNGKDEVVKLLLDHGADPSCQNAAGFTALMIATEENNVECVDLLLSSGKNCNITAQNLKGHNALMLAFSNVELIKKLIKLSDLSQIDSEGNSILHLAVVNDNMAGFNLLLNNPEILIDLQNYKGETPLHFAIQRKKLNLAYILVDKGADLLVKTSKGMNSFFFAAVHDDTEEFIKNYKHIFPHENIQDLFLFATDHGRLATTKRLISEVNDKVIIDGLLSTALQGHLDCAKFLLDHLQDLDEKVLLDAVFESLNGNHYDCFQFFYEKLLENAHDSENLLKETEDIMILTAVGSGCIQACELLLNKGVDPNGIDPETLLMVAAGNGQINLVKLLIEHKADINRVHENLGSALLIATINNFCDIFDLLLDNGADPTISDESGFTPLISAAYYGYAEIFSRLFEIDKNFEQRTKDGLTPLLAACHSGKREIVEVLLANGADIKVTDDSGNNCIHFAAEKAEKYDVMLYLMLFINNDSEILDTLLKSRNHDGKTPLDLIISHQDQKLIYSLIANQPVMNEYFSSSSEYVIESIDNNDMCLICRDDFELEDVATKLPCRHLFHKYCYEEWAITKPNCPYCQRFPFKLKK